MTPEQIVSRYIGDPDHDCNRALVEAIAAAILAENEACARISDQHWPESGHVRCDDAVSCPMSISILIRRRIPVGSDARDAALRPRSPRERS